MSSGEKRNQNSSFTFAWQVDQDRIFECWSLYSNPLKDRYADMAFYAT